MDLPASTLISVSSDETSRRIAISSGKVSPQSTEAVEQVQCTEISISTRTVAQVKTQHPPELYCSAQSLVQWVNSQENALYLDLILWN